MILELKKALALVAGGWVGPDLEPYCVARAPGVRINERFGQAAEPMWLPTETVHTLNAQHEGLELYSVPGALEAVGLGFEGLDALERALPMPAGLALWLRASERTLEDVKQLFVKAIQRSKKATGERR